MAKQSELRTSQSKAVKVFRFLQTQAAQIAQEVTPALRRKAVALFVVVLPSILMTPIILIVRAIRPWCLIRFGALRSNRIGHFAVDTELYLCKLNGEMQPSKTIDIFYHEPPICNFQLKKMWERILRVHPLARNFYLINRWLPGGTQNVVPIQSARDDHGLFVRTPPHLSFSSEEELRGKQALRELGIPSDAAYVCFHARDSAYLDVHIQSLDWTYHNYRDSSIANCLSAAGEMTLRGYYAIRMGSIVKEPLVTDNPMIIDYATKARSDFLDIFVPATCRFFICSNAGIQHIAKIFRRPVAGINACPLEDLATWHSRDLYIFKKYWLKTDRRFMTISEILSSGAGKFYRDEDYLQMGIELVENSPEEICALAVEMDERLKGTWTFAEEDEYLQKRFWSLFKSSPVHCNSVARIGAQFLRENRSLLE